MYVLSALSGTALPVDVRVRAAHEEFARAADVGALVEYGMLLLLAVAALYALSRLYVSRTARRHRML